MPDLEDTFGSEFAEQYEQERKRRMQERQKIDDETAHAIAAKAVEEFRDNPSEPHFQYQSETGITHDVLLMTLPDLEEGTVFSRFMNQLDSGAVTCPLDYMGEWMSCLFNDEEDLTKMEPGNEYLVVGELDQWENDKGEMNDQVSPVRGVISLTEVKKWSGDDIDEDINETPDMDGINEPAPEEVEEEPEPEEEAEEEEDEEEEEKKPSISFDTGDDEDEEEEEEDEMVPEDDVEDEMDLLVEHKEEVLEIEEGDDRLEDVVYYVQDELDLPDEEEVLIEIRDLVLEYLEETRGEEEEEEEEDSSESIFS